MLKDLVRSMPETVVDFELVFDDGRNNGFGFPCDAAGKPLNMSQGALENFDHCLKHPEKFVRFNEVVKRERTYRKPGEGTCSCGNRVVLENQYYGACQCAKCGRWYNLFGTELLPPDQWEERLEDDY